MALDAAEHDAIAGRGTFVVIAAPWEAADPVVWALALGPIESHGRGDMCEKRKDNGRAVRAAGGIIATGEERATLDADAGVRSMSHGSWILRAGSARFVDMAVKASLAF